MKLSILRKLNYASTEGPQGLNNKVQVNALKKKEKRKNQPPQHLVAIEFKRIEGAWFCNAQDDK